MVEPPVEPLVEVEVESVVVERLEVRPLQMQPRLKPRKAMRLVGSWRRL